MTEAARAFRKSPLLLVVALLLALVVALAALGAGWRARQPRVLQLSFGDLTVSRGEHPFFHVSFVGRDRLLVFERYASEDRFDFRGAVWSVETGERERTITPVPVHFAGSTRGLLWGEDRAVEAVDMTTGATTPLPFAIRYASALSSAGDVVAVLESTRGCVSFRSTRDGSLVRSVPISEPAKAAILGSLGASIQLSPAGTSLVARVAATDILWVADLATEAWWNPKGGFFLGFAKGGVVVQRASRRTSSWPVVLATPDGDRVVAPDASVFDLSASGERFAVLETGPGGSPGNVVIWRVETGEVHRRVPLLAGRKVVAVALSPEGDRLAVASEDGRVELWELP